MTTAVRYTLEQVTPFLRSLAGSGYSGEVVLFVDDALADLLRPATEAGVRVVRVHRSLRDQATRTQLTPGRAGLWAIVGVLQHVPVRLLPSGLLAWVAERLYAPSASRHFRYRAYLKRHRFRHVLVADSRDVLFQSDPFAQLPRDGLALSMESPSYTLASASANARWIRQTYDDDLLQRIGANHVSCAGVTCGTRGDMLRYLGLMTREILRLGRRGAAWGVDQAVHNKLLWTGELEPVRLMESLRSPVATLNGVPDAEIRVSRQGALLNADGSEPAVLHQYDRVPGLAERLVVSLGR